MGEMIKEGKGKTPPRAYSEGRRVAGELRALIKRSKMSEREIEKRVGWGQGTLTRVLAEPDPSDEATRTPQPLWISHILAVLDVLELDPADFFADVFGRSSRAGEGGGGGRLRGEETGVSVRDAVVGVLSELGYPVPADEPKRPGVPDTGKDRKDLLGGLLSQYSA